MAGWLTWLDSARRSPPCALLLEGQYVLVLGGKGSGRAQSTKTVRAAHAVKKTDGAVELIGRETERAGGASRSLVRDVLVE